jgi:hypothetical protein
MVLHGQGWHSERTERMVDLDVVRWKIEEIASRVNAVN